MNPSLFVCLLAASLLAIDTSDATSLAQKLIVRRQSGETEKESTTSGNINTNNGNNNQGSMQQQQPPPARLYPDLPQQPPGMYPYPAGAQGPFQSNFHGAPTPFVPFSPQLTPGQLSDLQRRMQQQQPRPVSSSERLQSQTFTNGLGRRLLAMIGLDQNQDPEANAAANETSSMADQTMRALQNATVLQQLNGGVQSIYGSLSKMYNSTVQQQLNLLQERFKKQAENSTNPWQQRMMQQVPMFFKNMAAKVGEAQENLDRVWKQMMAQASGNESMPASTERSGNQNQGFFDRFMNPNGAGPDMFGGNGGGNFFDQFGRSLGFGNGAQQQSPGAMNAGQGQDLGSQLMSFWHNQAQPQIGMVRGQIARIWRDLTTSGALAQDPMVMRRNQFSNTFASPASGENSTSSPELVDMILKEVDMSNSEYSIFDPKSSNDSQKQQQQQPQQPNMGSQMQNRLMTMQRELNQLWNGLTNSLQNAIGNVRNQMNARQPFGMTPSADSNQEADPEENEISGKVKDLGKLQKEADTVHDVLRQQQQQQNRQGFGDRFRSFFNNFDSMANDFDQLPTRFGNSVSRIGTAVGDLWNQIPRRWDNFMETMSPRPEMARAKLMAATDKPTQVDAPEKPPETTAASN